VATLQTLVVVLMHSRLDYGDAVLVSIPAYLQSALNAAARLIYRLGFRDHITDAIISLHWLRIPERVKYKVLLTVHNAATRYLGPLVRLATRSARTSLCCH